MPSLCPTLVPLYQSWHQSLAPLEVAKNQYQQSGSETDKAAFDKALIKVNQTKQEYQTAAHRLVEYKDSPIVAVEALVIETFDNLLKSGNGSNANLDITNGRITTINVNSNKSTNFQEAIKLIHNFKGLSNFDCSGTSITELPKLPDSLQRLRCSYTSITELPKLPDSLQTLDCSSTSITELPELPDSLTYINIENTPAAKDPAVITKLEDFITKHPNATVNY